MSSDVLSAANLRLAPDSLTPDEIAARLTTAWLGRTCYCFGTVGSTMDVARRLVASGAPDGTLVTAEEQTVGRGRAGRRWHSPPGLGLWCSMLVPSVQGIGPGGLTHIVAASVAAALRARGVTAVAVKWPNDVVVASSDRPGARPVRADALPCEWPLEDAASARKIAGILIEAATETRAPDGSKRKLVVGLGVNVNHRAEDFPSKLRMHATSVRIDRHPEPGNDGSQEGWVDRAELLAAILGEVETRFDRARNGTADDGAALVEEWNRVSLVLGRTVCVREADAELIGRALTIQPDGSLLVETGGVKRAIYGGPVSLRLTGTMVGSVSP